MHVFAIKGSVQRIIIRGMEVSNGNECPTGAQPVQPRHTGQPARPQGTPGKTNQEGNRGWNGMNINNTAYKTHLAGWGDGSVGKVLTHENPSSDS